MEGTFAVFFPPLALPLMAVYPIYTLHASLLLTFLQTGKLSIH